MALTGSPFLFLTNKLYKGTVLFSDKACNIRGAPKILPKAEEGENLSLQDLESKQNFTQPPPRYTEGSLVKELEANGIGRPSTYAPIISTIQDRDYVIREKGKFIPTELGLFVNGYLIKNFPDLMDFKFTANLEETLDSISEGEQDWQENLKSFYQLLIDGGLFGDEELQPLVQQGYERDLPFGRMLVELELLELSTHARLLHQHRFELSLPELLLETGIVSRPSELALALKHQQRLHLSLPEALEDLGLLTANQSQL